jgi:quercetin dioxygenase-like cupin family protein
MGYRQPTEPAARGAAEQREERIMLTRRIFAACALCAAGGFLATGAESQTAAPTGLKRTLIKQTDGPMDGYVTVEMRVDIDPNAVIARHTHPGIESGYVAEGGTELTIDGQGTLKLGAGDGFQVPTGVPHGGQNGAAKTVVISTYVVEKGKPLASPA